MQAELNFTRPKLKIWSGESWSVLIRHDWPLSLLFAFNSLDWQARQTVRPNPLPSLPDCQAPASEKDVGLSGHIPCQAFLTIRPARKSGLASASLSWLLGHPDYHDLASDKPVWLPGQTDYQDLASVRFARLLGLPYCQVCPTVRPSPLPVLLVYQASLSNMTKRLSSLSNHC